MAGGPGSILPGQRLPLAARAEHVQDAVHDLAEGNHRAPIGPPRFFGRQERLELGPEIIGNAPNRA